MLAISLFCAALNLTLYAVGGLALNLGVGVACAVVAFYEATA